MAIAVGPAGKKQEGEPGLMPVEVPKIVPEGLMVGGVIVPFEHSGEVEYALAELEPPPEWLVYAEEVAKKLVENPSKLIGDAKPVFVVAIENPKTGVVKVVGIGETNTGKYVIGTMAITPRMNENSEVVGLNMAYSGVTANPSYGEAYLMPRSLAEVVDALGNITGNWKVLATYPQGIGYKVEEVTEYSFDRAPQYEADEYKVLAEPTADSPFIAIKDGELVIGTPMLHLLDKEEEKKLKKKGETHKLFYTVEAVITTEQAT
jgi:hypothetical protein